jgi:DNA-binding response OmpR family regulator
MTTHTNVTLGATSAGSRTRTVLVADESDQVRAVITDNLTADGYCVRRADSRAGALAILTEDRVDAVVVDVNGDTLGLIDAIRCGSDRVGGLDRDVPVIALTAKASDAVHRIRLLDRGADDVLDKPFSYPELRSRIAAILRRAERRPAPAPALLEVGVLSINPAARTVRIDGQLIELTGKERELLRTLAAEPTRVFTRAELLRAVWDLHTPSRTLDSHFCRLRRKLADAGAGELVENLWGVGFRLVTTA